jgi:hypothetical protein
VVAVVGAAITILITGTFAYTQRIVDVTTYLTPLAGSLATILSAVFVVLLTRCGFGTVTIVITTIITTVVIAIAALTGAWWLQTEPGRLAARTAGDWRLVYQNMFTPDEPCVTNTEDVYGSGKACISGGVITVWLNNWYALRVQGPQPGSQDATAGVSEFEGTYPGRFYSGPTAERSIDLSSWTSAAIKASGDSYDFFIDNRLVDHAQEIGGVQGSINIGTLAPESTYRTTEACQFRGLIV